MSAVAVLVLTQPASVCVKERGRALRETVLLKLPTHFGIGLPGGQLCGVYSSAAVLHVEPAASAGSLAVISQPAFLPFGLAVAYLPSNACVAYDAFVFACFSSCLSCLNAFLFTCEPMFMTLWIWAWVMRLRRA